LRAPATTSNAIAKRVAAKPTAKEPTVASIDEFGEALVDPPGSGKLVPGYSS
jgi:hypothetical protein